MLSSFIYGNSHVFSISQSIPSSCQIGISHQHWSQELCSLHWHPHISKSDHRLLEDLSGLCAGSVIRDNPESGAPWELGERVDLWTLLKDPHLVYFLSFSHSLPSIFFSKYKIEIKTLTSTMHLYWHKTAQIYRVYQKYRILRPINLNDGQYVSSFSFKIPINRKQVEDLLLLHKLCHFTTVKRANILMHCMKQWKKKVLFSTMLYVNKKKLKFQNENNLNEKLNLT